jgi:Pyruvate/2-oxoacid:ferredoxin oxidoreductase delta subunit
MKKARDEKQLEFDGIDLNDPTTKAFYDIFPEDRKDEFPEAYLHLKHYTSRLSITENQWTGAPLTKEAKELLERRPEMVEMGLKTAAQIMESGKGGPKNAAVHGKTTLYKDVRKLLTKEVEINLEVDKKVVPLEKSRKIILDNPTSVALGKCPCRMVQPEPCKIVPYPYEVCLFVGDPVAQFVAEYSDMGFRMITQEEALKVLENNHKMGLVANPLWRELYDGRLYCICSCCACCCLVVKVHNNCIQVGQPSWAMSPSGYVAEIGDDCNGCETCVEKCQFEAIKLNEDETRAEINFDRCMGCGACEISCPMEAVTMRVEPSKGGILDLDEIRKATETRM